MGMIDAHMTTMHNKPAMVLTFKSSVTGIFNTRYMLSPVLQGFVLNQEDKGEPAIIVTYGYNDDFNGANGAMVRMLGLGTIEWHQMDVWVSTLRIIDATLGIPSVIGVAPGESFTDTMVRVVSCMSESMLNRYADKTKKITVIQETKDGNMEAEVCLSLDKPKEVLLNDRARNLLAGSVEFKAFMNLHGENIKWCELGS